MKTRSGFVSNSSTSSFFCVLWEEDHKTVFNVLTPEQQARLSQIFETGEIGPVKVVGFGRLSTDGGVEYSGCGETDDDLYEARSAYDKIRKKLNIKSFSMSFDM
jgi:hypothetical protein